MKLLAKISTTLAVVAALGTAPVSGQLFVNTGWQFFSWSGTGPVSSPWDTFTFNPGSTAIVRLTDFLVVGDRFRLSWTGTTSGFFDTSVPLDDGSTEGDPDVAFASGDFSAGSAVFGPGSYTFTLETIGLATGFPTGTGAIEAVSTVPEPATMTLLATGLAGMAAARRRKKS